MLRRFLPLTSLAVLSTFTPRADAAGAFLSGGAAAPIEQRVALAVSPERVTLWTSLRLNTSPGPFGVVVPVPPGASLDHSSDAWFEALEAATSPRIFPPAGVSPYCPGFEGSADPFHVTANLDESPGLSPLESVLLDSPGAVTAWAALHELTLAPETAAALQGMAGTRFFAERFQASGGTTMTRTLRVVIPGGKPVLPLALTRAGAEDLHVTTWLIGPGRGNLQGTEQVGVPLGELHWNAALGTSNYLALRASTLTGKGTDASLLEAASHAALAENTAIASGKASIPGAMIDFFERASLYGDAQQDPTLCIGTAAAALDASAMVSMSCPRADLGVVDGTDTCKESPAAGQIDPAMLRCGGTSDDLAVALAGLSPSNTWLTRRTMLLPKGASGLGWSVSFAAGASVAPVLAASSIDLAACDASSSSASASSGAGAGAGPGSSGAGAGPIGNPTGGIVDYGPAYDDDADVGCGCTSGAVEPIITDGAGGGTGGYGGDGAGGSDEYYYDDSSEDCSGDTSDGSGGSGGSDDSSDDSSEDCSGDTSDGSDDYDDSSDDCSGDTSDDYDDSSDDCGGDTSGDSSSDDCSGDTGDGSDGWDDGSSSGETSSSDSDSASSECSIATRRAPQAARKRGPKLSMLTLGLLAVVAPLRRMRRPDRTPRHARKLT